MNLTRAPADPSLKGPASSEPWHASMRLHLSGQSGQTRIVDRHHRGPLVVQRPFYPEPDGSCHLYIVHPPGGVVGGDELDLSVAVTESGRALVTTPAATKLYRSAGPTSRVWQRLLVERGSLLEWLPQETIAFDSSRSDITTSVELEAGASYIGWDTICIGRPAANEGFDRGRLVQHLRLRRAGQLLLDERLVLHGAGPELEAAWGLRGATALATLVAADASGDASALLEPVRDALPRDLGLVAVTTVSGLLVCRVLTRSARYAHHIMRAAWEAIRQELLQKPAVDPRVWAT